jgi:hypothetical protein
MLDYIRVIIEFISQHEHKDLIPMFGIVKGGACLFSRAIATDPPYSQPPGIEYDVLTSLYVALPPPLFPPGAPLT